MGVSPNVPGNVPAKSRPGAGGAGGPPERFYYDLQGFLSTPAAPWDSQRGTREKQSPPQSGAPVVTGATFRSLS